MVKTACFILAVGDFYEALGWCAKRSFKKWHPEIEVIFNNKQQLGTYNFKDNEKIMNHIPLMKMMSAYEYCKKNEVKKAIILGADTITCAKLDEFLEDDETDILATLDYPYPLQTANFTTPGPDSHVNADVICFNNLEAILDIIRLTPQYPVYHEQAALNHIMWAFNNKYTFKIVDGPYADSKVVYNARSKGNICALTCTDPFRKFIQRWEVKDNKLYTHNEKQIKMWHYCAGFHCSDKTKLSFILRRWKNEIFNKDTINFFSEVCNCKEFFDGIQ